MQKLGRDEIQDFTGEVIGEIMRMRKKGEISRNTGKRRSRRCKLGHVSQAVG